MSAKERPRGTRLEGEIERGGGRELASRGEGADGEGGLASRKKTERMASRWEAGGGWSREEVGRDVLERGVEGASERTGLASRGDAEGIGFVREAEGDWASGGKEEGSGFERDGGKGLASGGEAEGIGLEREKKPVEGRTRRR